MNPSDSKLEADVPGSAEPPAPEFLPVPAPIGPDPRREVEEPGTKGLSKNEKDKDQGKKGDDQRDGKKDKGKKKQKREKESRAANGWQRYRALHDTLKEAQDLIDLADHKARFALIIMGALNAAILILATRSDLISRLSGPAQLWLYLYFSLYAVIAVYFFVQAIESLRPRSDSLRPKPGFATDPAAANERAKSLGVRFFSDALRYDLPEYVSAWQNVSVSQLNEEIAIQLYTVARINKAKYNAIAKLYSGLQAITLLTWGLLVAIAVFAWVEHEAATVMERAANPVEIQNEAPAKIKAGKPKKGGWAILGEPQRLAVTSVKEPSGVVFSPKRGTLFVVGDEGSLVEISPSGDLLARLPMGGNLEDVALHTPSGRLVLLSEKKGELIVFDPTTGTRTARFKIDEDEVLGAKAVDKNQGFEGLAFRPDPARLGGGVFYLVHQRSPALVVALAFDPLAPSGRLGAESVLSRSTVSNREDLTAVTYDASLDRLFVIADSKDRVAMLGVALEEEAEIVLPGAQQEGLTFDAEGNLWIADDRAGLLIFRGARARIAEEMKAARSESLVSDPESVKKSSEGAKPAGLAKPTEQKKPAEQTKPTEQKKPTGTQ